MRRKINVIVFVIMLTVAMGAIAYAENGGIGNTGGTNNTGNMDGNTRVTGNESPGDDLSNSNRYRANSADDFHWDWFGYLGLAGLVGLLGRNRNRSPQR